LFLCRLEKGGWYEKDCTVGQRVDGGAGIDDDFRSSV
jgi:hypothetical protein